MHVCVCPARFLGSGLDLLIHFSGDGIQDFYFKNISLIFLCSHTYKLRKRKHKKDLLAFTLFIH